MKAELSMVLTVYFLIFCKIDGVSVAFTVRKVIFFKNSGNKMYSVNARLLLNT